MTLIKLDATDSTNRYLKELYRSSAIENFTVVYTNNQTHGVGQMGSKWQSEVGKNITMSILVKNIPFDKTHIFDLNIVVACSVYEILHHLKVPNISIKWPNDMMSDHKKIGGILIENLLNSMQIVSIIGIGINVNQVNFTDLPKATSIKIVTARTFMIEKLILMISEKIEQNYHLCMHKTSKHFWDFYHDHLYKKNIPMAFEDPSGLKFMGIIKNVEGNGKIKIQLEDDSFSCFDVKEIKMLF